MEAGETELGALSRELHEELGVHIEKGSVSHLCRLNVATEEHADIAWFDLEELPPLAHELVQTALLAAVG